MTKNFNSVKMEKWNFLDEKSRFWVTWLVENKVRMDPKKVQTIVDSQAPSGVKELTSFFGFGKLLPEVHCGLFKKGCSFDWIVEKECQVGLVRSK